MRSLLRLHRARYSHRPESEIRHTMVAFVCSFAFAEEPALSRARRWTAEISSRSIPDVCTHLTRRVAMRKMRWLLASLVAVALLPGYALSQERVNITGQIVEAGSQRPLQGALVAIERLRLNV